MQVPEEHLITYRVQKAAVFWGIIQAYLAIAVAGAAIYGLLLFVPWTLR